MSRRLLLSILKPQLRPGSTYTSWSPPPSSEILSSSSSARLAGWPQQQPTKLRRLTHSCHHTHHPQPRRYASSSAGGPSKPIVLEKPDKFRPPSHPARLNRRPPRQYPGPPLSSFEREAQKTRKYPHMFPNEGTRMHWFLTNRWIHLWISLGTLGFLALITLTQSFIHTSPFAHLLPPISSFPTAPIHYVSEWISVFRLHINYNTEQTAESRRQNILDAQKRRLYRRAHGMEDLDAEEEQGIDVRGLVEWDDGLTNKERAEGGRPKIFVTGKDVLEKGGQIGDPLVLGEDGSPISRIADGSGDGTTTTTGEEQAQRKRRPVKKWLGIW